MPDRWREEGWVFEWRPGYPRLRNACEVDSLSCVPSSVTQIIYNYILLYSTEERMTDIYIYRNRSNDITSVGLTPARPNNNNGSLTIIFATNLTIIII